MPDCYKDPQVGFYFQVFLLKLLDLFQFHFTSRFKYFNL